MNETAQMIIRLGVLYFVIIVVCGIVLAALRISSLGPILVTGLAIVFIMHALSILQKKK